MAYVGSRLRNWPKWASVNGLSWDHPPHSTSRVYHIAFTARNQMDVSMTNGLSSSFTIIHADVEAAY